MTSETIKQAVDRLAQLPGIGPRHAARLVYFLLKTTKKDVDSLADGIRALKIKVNTCPVCFSSFEPSEVDQKTCSICANQKRQKTSICIVEKEADREPIEHTGLFKGVYHVVGEHVDTLGKTPAQSVKRLLERITYIKNQLPEKKQSDMEIILAMNATTEGDAIVAYLEKLIKPLGVPIARLGRGLSSGSELEYADQETLTAALENRKPR